MEPTVSEGEGNERALLVAMPLRHLESGAELCRRDGSVVLPAGGPGGLDDVPPSSRVLLIPTDTGEEAPAASWAAAFQGRVGHQEGEPWPAGLPPTWVDEHPEQVMVPREPPPPEDDDDDDLDPEGVGPQAFFRVRGLERLPRTEWVFANEVVPKQQRGGRTFVPRVPTLVTLPP
jgi:hypothetical protein